MNRAGKTNLCMHSQGINRRLTLNTTGVTSVLAQATKPMLTRHDEVKLLDKFPLVA